MSADNRHSDKYNRDFVELDGAALAEGELAKKPGAESLTLSELEAQGAFYCCVRVVDLPVPAVRSAVRICLVCGWFVWVDWRTVESADCLRVICIPCLDRATVADARR